MNVKTVFELPTEELVRVKAHIQAELNRRGAVEPTFAEIIDAIRHAVTWADAMPYETTHGQLDLLTEKYNSVIEELKAAKNWIEHVRTKPL